MKSIKILSLLAGMLPAVAFAQSQFKLEVEQTVANNTLFVDFYIQKTSGPDFALGSSNFAVFVNENNLDMASMYKVAGTSDKWDISVAPNGYLSTAVGGKKFVHLAVRRNTAANANAGQLVTSSRERIGRVGVPITNGCTTQDAQWVIAPVEILDFSGKSVKANAEFVTPEAGFKLCEVPSVSQALTQGTPTACQGTAVVLTASTTANIQWYKDGQPIANANQSTLTVTESGNYTAQAQNCICTADATPIAVQVIPVPTQPVVLQNADTLFASAADNYQWYLNGVAIQGATGQYIVPTQNGDYSVKVFNSCGEATSTPVNFSVTSLAANKIAGVKLSAAPNPFAEQTVINYTIPRKGDVSFEVFNTLGVKVATLAAGNLAAGQYQAVLKIAAENRASGVYFARLSYEGKVQVLKLVEIK
jgi:hypothetical protein